MAEFEEAMKDIDAKIGASYGKEIYLKTVTECKPFWQRAEFCLTVIEHPLAALQRCISLRCHTSYKESATPAEEIPELSAEQAER